MAPFYLTLCSDIQQPVDNQLYDRLKAANVNKLEKLDAAIEDAEKNFGEIESRDALMKKAEYLCQIGDKVSNNCPIIVYACSPGDRKIKVTAWWLNLVYHGKYEYFPGSDVT